eukprot:scaffold903_cov262-Pinguiococcus_pyrenoidosus.AAC.7
MGPPQQGLRVSRNGSCRCPICFKSVEQRDLRLAKPLVIPTLRPKDRVHFTLLTRAADSLVPRLQYRAEPAEDGGFRTPDAADAKFQRILRVRFEEVYERLCLEAAQLRESYDSCLGFRDLHSAPYYAYALALHNDLLANWTVPEDPRVPGGRDVTKATSVPRHKPFSFYQHSSGAHVFLHPLCLRCLVEHTERQLGIGVQEDQPLESSRDYGGAQAPHPVSGTGEELPLGGRALPADEGQARGDPPMAQEGRDLGGQQVAPSAQTSGKRGRQLLGSELPAVLSTAKVVEVEQLRLTEELRKRHPFLRHLPKLSDVTFVEIDLAPLVSAEVLKQFSSELKKRSKRRARAAQALQRQEQEERRREEEKRQQQEEYLRQIEAFRRGPTVSEAVDRTRPAPPLDALQPSAEPPTPTAEPLLLGQPVVDVEDKSEPGRANPSSAGNEGEGDSSEAKRPGVNWSHVAKHGNSVDIKAAEAFPSLGAARGSPMQPRASGAGWGKPSRGSNVGKEADMSLVVGKGPRRKKKGGRAQPEMLFTNGGGRRY